MHPGVGGGIQTWEWRWDPALELELAASLGWAPFQACALLNIFIILNSLFPPCILLAPALGRDGDPANGSDPWEHHPGLREGGCDTCGNHRRFRCVYEPGHNFLCLGFPARPRALHGHPGRAVGGGGAAPMGDNPCHDRGGCAAGTRQRGIWGGGLQLFASIPASWDVCGLGGWAVTPG